MNTNHNRTDRHCIFNLHQKIQIAEAPCFNNGDEQFASMFILKLINIFDIITL